MNLRDVVEQAVANAFHAGVEWLAIHNGQDSATVARQMKRWQTHLRYQEELRRQQKAAVEAVAAAIMRVRLVPTALQVALFESNEHR